MLKRDVNDVKSTYKRVYKGDLFIRSRFNPLRSTLRGDGAGERRAGGRSKRGSDNAMRGKGCTGPHHKLEDEGNRYSWAI